MKFINSVRIGLSAIAVLAITLGLAGTASAQDYTSTATTNISGPVTPGGTVQVSGVSGAGCEVEITIDGVMVSTSTVAAGDYAIPVTLPSNLSAGSHALVIEICGAVTSQTQFSVAAAAQNNAQQLAETGGEAGPVAQLGLALMAAGGFFLVLRRRNTADVAS